jgi:hypothetical protein
MKKPLNPIEPMNTEIAPDQGIILTNPTGPKNHVVTEPEPKIHDVDKVVQDTVQLFNLGLKATKKGLQSILAGSLRLNWLRLEHSAQGKRNDLDSDGTKSGFKFVLRELDLAPATAYRWINRAKEFAAEIGISDCNYPVPGSDEWARMEKFVRNRVEVLDSFKLPVQAFAVPQDEEIMTRLRVAAESGHQVAAQLLVELDSGETTMEEATLRYCRVEKSDKRTMPAMLRLDTKTMKPQGLMMKALDTLENGFLGWDEYPVEARLQAKQRIREIFALMPKECNFHEF